MVELRKPYSEPLTVPLPVTLARVTRIHGKYPASPVFALVIAVLGLTPLDPGYWLVVRTVPPNVPQLPGTPATSGALCTTTETAENPVLE